MPLHPKGVLKLAVPEAGRAVHFDTGPGGVPGLAVRVTAAGARAFWFVYRDGGATKRWVPLGDVAEVALADAREKAHELRVRVGKARRGETTFPHEDQRAARRADAEAGRAVSFERVATAWRDSDAFKALRDSTQREYGRMVRNLLVPALGPLDPRSIRREDVAALLFDIRDGTKDRERPRFTLTDATAGRDPAGVTSNRARAVLGSLYRWLTAEDQRSLYGVTENPLLGLERIFEEPEPRPRVYSPDELRRIFAAVEDVEELRHLVPLIAYTLTRSNEARGACWKKEFDFELGRELWTVPAERSKDHRQHVVPLSHGALRVLTALRIESRVVDIRSANFLFSAATKAGYMDQPQDSIRAVRTASGVEDFSLHPLRDTAAHWLIEELRVRGDVVEDLLSHTPTRLERTYRGDRRSSLIEMREALDLWSSKLDEILGIAGKGKAGRRGKAGKAGGG